MRKSGFTIIELIVGMVLFTLVVGAAVSIFLSIVKYQRQILAEENLLSQISYAQERISKALRMAKEDETGYIYHLTRPVSGFYTGIKFINQSNNDATQEFFLENGVLKEIINDSTPVPLTPESMDITKLRFGINGADGCAGIEICPDGATGQDKQPRVTLLFSVKVAGSEDQTAKTIQTTISQRNINE